MRRWWGGGEGQAQAGQSGAGTAARVAKEGGGGGGGGRPAAGRLQDLAALTLRMHSDVLSLSFVERELGDVQR